MSRRVSRGAASARRGRGRGRHPGRGRARRAWAGSVAGHAGQRVRAGPPPAPRPAPARAPNLWHNSRQTWGPTGARAGHHTPALPHQHLFRQITITIILASVRRSCCWCADAGGEAATTPYGHSTGPHTATRPRAERLLHSRVRSSDVIYTEHISVITYNTHTNRQTDILDAAPTYI